MKISGKSLAGLTVSTSYYPYLVVPKNKLIVVLLVCGQPTGLLVVNQANVLDAEMCHVVVNDGMVSLYSELR